MVGTDTDPEAKVAAANKIHISVVKMTRDAIEMGYAKGGTAGGGNKSSHVVD